LNSERNSAANLRLIRHLAAQPVLVELAQVAEAVRAGEAEEDAVDVGLELREIRAVVGYRERRKRLLHDPAAEILEHALEAGAHLVAVGNVVGDYRHPAHLELLVAVVGERLRALGRGRSTTREPRIGLALRHVFRRRHRQRQQLLLPDVVVRRESLGGGERPDHDLDVLPFHELLDLGARLRRHAARIADEQLDLAAGERAVALAQVHDQRALHVDAARSQGSCLNGHQSQADRPCLCF